MRRWHDVALVELAARDRAGRYRGYFENEHGKQAMFVYDCVLHERLERG